MDLRTTDQEIKQNLVAVVSVVFAGPKLEKNEEGSWKLAVGTAQNLQSKELKNSSSCPGVAIRYFYRSSTNLSHPTG